MGSHIAIAVGINAVFFVIVIVILYRAYRKEHTFTEYAVGGRSFGPWYIAMSYVNSWFPGTMFISFLGLGVASGVVGLYVLSYSLIGVTTMYYMATRAWNWGQAFNLRTQPDMLGLRYGSPTVKVIASVIGVVSLFPWVILSMQSLGVLFDYMTYQQLGTTAALILGVGVIVVRQYWTVRMGMRGLVITDLFQGIIAYVVCSVMIVVLMSVFFDGMSAIHSLGETMWNFPGDGGTYGIWYFSAITFTGIVGSLCWPTSYQRIYTASSVRNVKLGTLFAMPIIGVFATLLLFVSFSMASLPDVAAKPQLGWFITAIDAGGPWLLGLACMIVFAAAMGWIDGCIQVSGTQLSNDIIGNFKELSDQQLTKIAKASMVGFLCLGAVVAYLAYNDPKLVNLAIISYQGVVQLSVPLFGGLFWRRGTREGAIVGMTVGFVLALILTAFYPDNIPGLGGLTAGIPALALNLLIYLAFATFRPQSAEERARVDELFTRGERSLRAAPASVPARAVPETVIE
jgi:Na+/proline symporter